MEYKTLSVKGTILTQNQLENYLETIATDHNLQNTSNKNTYPIPRLKENFDIITEVYELLNEHIKLKIQIHPAGEWILDNYYIIDETVKNIKQELTLKKYTSFLGLANGMYAGFARIYVLASEIVNYTNNRLDAKTLSSLLKAYQKKKSLSMEEIWNIGLFLKIALIENVREVCEKIYSSQVQKYKVENIIERLVENKEKEELQFNHLNVYKEKIKSNYEMKYPFIEYLSYRLKKYGKRASSFLMVLEEQVNKMGMTVEEVAEKEHFDIALRKIAVGNCITSIKTLSRINMAEIFEEINGVEDILKQDPAGVYEKMDYQTKALYRSKIKEFSKKTKISEIYISKKCLELSKKSLEDNNLIAKENSIDINKLDTGSNNKGSNNKGSNNKGSNNTESNSTENNIEENNKTENSNKTKSNEQTEFKEVNKKCHVGYYLLAEGKETLFKELTGKKKRQVSYKAKIIYVISTLAVLTIVTSFLFSLYLYKQIHQIFWSILLAILLVIPVEVILVQLGQHILGKFVKPKIIPKLDYTNGVPDSSATFVVIPTILSSKDKVKSLMQRLEVYYMANKSDNIYFALLGDCTASQNEAEPFDEEVIKEGVYETERLNKLYPSSDFPRFHFLYRKRTWNPKEECYLGWERKRGLLNQFNEFILAKEKDSFLVNTIEEAISKLESPNMWRNGNKIKYIITLDADTRSYAKHWIRANWCNGPYFK